MKTSCEQTIIDGECELSKEVDVLRNQIKGLSDVSHALHKENAELQKRLACPAVVWKEDGKAFSCDFQIGYANNGIWIFAFDDC